MKYRVTQMGFTDRLVRPGEIIDVDGPPPIGGLVPIDEPAPVEETVVSDAPAPKAKGKAKGSQARAAPEADGAGEDGLI